MSSRGAAKRMAATQPFQGYPPPTSNTTYTPNQFFDVVLPCSSRGVVRLVAYIIRKTLGWCDADGNPQQPEVVVSYNELIERAGIARSMIRPAIDEAIAMRCINCIRPGRSKSARTPASLVNCRNDIQRNPIQYDALAENEAGAPPPTTLFFNRQCVLLNECRQPFYHGIRDRSDRAVATFRLKLFCSQSLFKFANRCRKVGTGYPNWVSKFYAYC